MKIGTSYSDLVNTVGIPSSVSWSSMLGSEFFLTFYYKLSDSRSVIIHFGRNRTISEITGPRRSSDISFHVALGVHLTRIVV